jgi:hypothetical protein
MKVFISWSGDRSRKVAELLDDWIQCVIQAVHPWMSSKDIDRGALWFSEISDQLATTSIGIVCLTKDNKTKPWVLFEAGALAKGLTSNRVCTFLIDLVPTDLENPLAQFNHTFPNREGIWELVRTINLSCKDNALKESILSKVFDTYYPQFEVEFSQIIATTPDVEVKEARKGDEVLLEVLSTVRLLDRRLRSIETQKDKEPIGGLEIERERQISPSIARHKIREYLDLGMSKEGIVEILSTEYGILPGWIRDQIEMQLKVRPDHIE